MAWVVLPFVLMSLVVPVSIVPDDVIELPLDDEVVVVVVPLVVLQPAARTITTAAMPVTIAL